MIPSSDRIAQVHSDIRGPLYVEALQMQAAGISVLKLNTGNLGSFGFALPESVRRSLIHHIDRAVPYCDVKGMPEARAAICRYHQGRGLQGITPEDIFICNGVSEAVSMLMTALVGNGDEILVPSPCYSLWSNNTYIGGGRPVFYRCDPANGWNPDPEDIRRKLSPRSKAILIINPNNPTGAVYSRDILLEIAQIARQNRLLLLTDEIYDRLTMDGAVAYSIAALAPDVPCVTFNGLSKSHVICGFRCGWMVFSGPQGALDEVQDGVMRLASMRLCGNALTQLVIPAALEDQKSTDQMVQGRVMAQRNACVGVLEQLEGVQVVKNQAAFYVFPKIQRELFDFEDDQDFAMRFLHEKQVLVIPGRGFDWFEDLRFRIVMLPEPDKLSAAMWALGDFLKQHRRCAKAAPTSR